MNDIKTGNGKSSIGDLLGVLPDAIGGMNVEWIKREPPGLHELGQLESGEIHLRVFGVKYLRQNFLLEGMASRTGYIANVFCLMEIDGRVQYSCVLDQRKNSVYSPEHACSEGSVGVSKVKPISDYCLEEPPRWKSSEAEWPLYEGRPMSFLGQIDVPSSLKNELIPFAGHSLFFFLSFDQKTIKATRQELKLQTLRGHYAQEQKRAKSRSNSG